MSVGVAQPESSHPNRKSSGRDMLRRIVPFAVRVELARLRRWPSWRAERADMALRKLSETDLDGWHSLFKYRSPLRRSSVSNEMLQRGKEINVALAAAAIDGIVLDPGQVFSYHHAVGRPSRLRGFRKGLELHGRTMESGVGGGCCQVSNLLYWLALNAGLEIVERHRHALDLFPDHGRTIPFGCGATVFYNLSDLRIRNPHGSEVLIRLTIDDGFLVGTALSRTPLEYRYDIREEGHRFRKEADGWWRENRIVLETLAPDGSILNREVIADNAGRCLYDPEAPPE